MDIIDKQILDILSKDADVSNLYISEKVNLSVPAVNKRIAKLKSDKIIKNYTIITDSKKVNKPITSFIFIVMRYGVGVDTFLEYIQNEADVLECYAVTGEYDYLIKFCSKDIQSLEEKLLHLKNQKGVIKSHTMISLQEHKFNPSVLPDKKE